MFDGRRQSEFGLGEGKMSYHITEKSFTITLTSNEFQDLFPNNTVSRFRAKLPVQFILPTANYKVALAKFFYRNTINNFGSRGAKTVFHISDGKHWVTQKSFFPNSS
jgi:hypothetical protein